MKKFIYLSILAIGILFVGCSTYDPPELDDWSSTRYGSLQFINNNNDPYIIKVKGNTSMTFTLAANSYIVKSVEVGYYTVHVKQKSGYLFYPTEKEGEFYVKQNETVMVSF